MTDKHTLAPPELAERALVEELATQMALAAGYAPHCWPTWEQEATVIIPTITKHMATRITSLEAREAELVEGLTQYRDDLRYPPSPESKVRRLEMIAKLIERMTP